MHMKITSAFKFPCTEPPQVKWVSIAFSNVWLYSECTHSGLGTCALINSLHNIYCKGTLRSYPCTFTDYTVKFMIYLICCLINCMLSWRVVVGGPHVISTERYKVPVYSVWGHRSFVVISLFFNVIHICWSVVCNEEQADTALDIFMTFLIPVTNKHAPI